MLADKNATTLKQAVLSTAGVTLGTGEGGNAFGDRFFIRGFDARNDVFIDGVRDAGVSVRENFFTEQVEILRGPGSSFAGRGTTGGAINIVTKQATTEKSFYNMDTTFGTDHTKRVTLDVNQVISPTLAIRAGGLFQDAGVAGRDYITDDRDGGFVAAKWTPIDAVKVTGELHSYRSARHCRTSACRITGRVAGATHRRRPVPGFRRQPQQFLWLRQSRLLQDQAGHRHDQRRSQDHAGPDAEQQVRVQRSVLDYIGTLPEAPIITNPIRRMDAQRQSAEPLSGHRRLANQTEATYKFDTGGWQQHGARRRRNLARDSPASTNIPASARKRCRAAVQRHRVADRRQHLQSAIHVPAVRRHAGADRACRPRSRSIPRAAI